MKLAYSASGDATHIPADASGLLVNLGANNDVVVTNAGTFAVQVDGDALTSLQAIETAVEGTLVVSGTVTANLSATDNAVLDNIDADLTTIIGHVDGVEGLLTTIDADTSNLSVVGGGTEAAAIRVTIANDSTGVLSIDDNGGAITVDGTVTADLGATDNAVLDAIAASVAAIDGDTSTIIGHVDGIEGLLTTIDGDTGSILTAVQLIDNLVLAEDAAHQSADPGVQALAVRDASLGGAKSGTDGDYEPLHTDNDGALWTDEIHSAAIAAAVETIDNAISGNEMQVDVVAALPAGTALLGSTVASGSATMGTGLSTVTDGDVDSTDQEIKGSAGRLYHLQVYNPNSTVSYLQLFDDATVTVGTDAPKLSFPIPALGFWDAYWPIGIHFAAAIHYAGTTTRAGNGDPATGLVMNAGYV